jgi:hypothetical protein
LACSVIAVLSCRQPLGVFLELAELGDPGVTSPAVREEALRFSMPDAVTRRDEQVEGDMRSRVAASSLEALVTLPEACERQTGRGLLTAAS